jgi:hypothetical protein
MSESMIKNSNWSWKYCEKSKTLNVTVITNTGAQYEGSTDFAIQMLCNEAVKPHNPFTQEDVDSFLNFYERLSDIVPGDSDRMMWALKATAMRRFHKNHALADDWFQSTGKSRSHEEGEVVIIATEYRGVNGKAQEGNLLIVDADEASCYGILISNETLNLDGSFLMKAGSCVHISNDKTLSISCLNRTILQTLNIA